ncbi:superoxide dismutase [Cu-Zn]-like [Gordionus sp. m RMFG-2023]|uniref:superoxide dismutase [Cu-Zn]-like n=1 Tax=Gordionus sp. m RMFG-2023 TaxID=3053472 RepID=UPI0031FDAE9D
MTTIIAFCILAGALKGRINFKQIDNGSVTLDGYIKGLTPGLHGFHVHQYGNLSRECLASGIHFNPTGLTHGSPDSLIRHVGDLGNIEASQSGEAKINIKDNIISLDPASRFSILNRAIVVHKNKDDLGKGGNEESLKTGNAGDRIDCCIITRQGK